MTLTIKVENVDFDKFPEEVAIQTAFEDTIKDAVVQHAGEGISPGKAKVSLVAGAVEVAIYPPGTITTDAVMGTLTEKKLELEEFILKTIKTVGNIDKVSSGDITVTIDKMEAENPPPPQPALKDGAVVGLDEPLTKESKPAVNKPENGKNGIQVDGRETKLANGASKEERKTEPVKLVYAPLGGKLPELDLEDL